MFSSLPDVANLFDMKEIQLTQGYVALVDDEDFDYLNQWKWCVKIKSNTIYVVRTIVINYKPKKTKTIRMHRLIMLCNIGKIVDHIDHNGLNNQKNNLRFCTTNQNRANSIKTNKYTTSKFKGVTLNKKSNKWISKMTINKKNIHIGCYKDEIDAAMAYDKKAKEIYGEFANLNFK